MTADNSTTAVTGPYAPYATYAEWAEANGHPDRLKGINNVTISPQGRHAINELRSLLGDSITDNSK